VSDTIRLYSAIHVGTRWKEQARTQIKNRHTIKTKHNPEKAKQHKIQQNRTSLVQSPHSTLGRETRWAYSTMLLSPHAWFR